MADELSDQARKIDTGGGDYEERPAIDSGHLERSAESRGRLSARLDGHADTLNVVNRKVDRIGEQVGELVLQSREAQIYAKRDSEQVNKCHSALFGNGKWGLVNLCRFSRGVLVIYLIAIIVFVIIALSGYTEIMQEINELRAEVEAILGGMR